MKVKLIKSAELSMLETYINEWAETNGDKIEILSSKLEINERIRYVENSAPLKFDFSTQEYYMIIWYKEN